jgi:hypothetical protein
MTEKEARDYLIRTGLGARAAALNPPKSLRVIDQVGIDMGHDPNLSQPFLTPAANPAITQTANKSLQPYPLQGGGTLTTDLRWTIFLPDQLKSQNDFDKSKNARRLRHQETKHLEVAIHLALLEQGFRTGTPHASKQRLTITRHLGPRQRLWDDAFGNGGSTKQLVDAIKRLGWMTDDSPRWLEGVLIQDPSRRNRPGTTITLERLRLERTKP